MAIVALILAVFAVVGTFAFYTATVGWIAAAASLVFAVVALRKKERVGMASAAILVSMASLVLAFIWRFLTFGQMW